LLLTTVFGTLITVRSLKQGVSVARGKQAPEYQETVAVLEMAREDMGRLGIAPGGRVRVRSLHGEIVVACREADLPGGLFCLAMGPVANRLVDPDTGGSGMPAFKSTAVSVEPCTGE